jgi:hypothetical protein
LALVGQDATDHRSTDRTKHGAEEIAATIGREIPRQDLNVTH